VIQVVQKNDGSIQRLYIEDNTSHWSEGLNEYGVCIISSALNVVQDEDEVGQIDIEKGYRCIEGEIIRDALYEDEPEDALLRIIKKKLTGLTFVFNEERCFLLEAMKDARDNYRYKVKKVSKELSEVRTNHGVLLPWAGYQDSKEKDLQKKRDSSLSRQKAVEDMMGTVRQPQDLMAALAVCPNKNFFNPIRKGDSSKGEMVTTGQLLLTSKDRTLHFRPIFGGIDIKDYHKLNDKDMKTSFEIISDRKLLSFKEHVQHPY